MKGIFLLYLDRIHRKQQVFQDYSDVHHYFFASSRRGKIFAGVFLHFPNSRQSFFFIPLPQGVVSAICKRFKIPHFTLFWQPLDIDNFNSTDSFTRNLFPHPKLFSQAILEIIKSFRWKTLAFIYEESDNLIKMQDVLSTNSGFDMFEKQFAYYYKIPADSTDFKPLLKDISKWGINQVMIDCSLKNTYSILAQSVDVNMHSEYVVCFRHFHTFLSCSVIFPNFFPIFDVYGNVYVFHVSSISMIFNISCIFDSELFHSKQRWLHNRPVTDNYPSQYHNHSFNESIKRGRNECCL